MTYEEAKAAAQERAEASGQDVGVFKVHGGFSFQGLPALENRYGWEVQCEVVSCSDLARCWPGHGPLARRPPPRMFGTGWRGA